MGEAGGSHKGSQDGTEKQNAQEGGVKPIICEDEKTLRDFIESSNSFLGLLENHRGLTIFDFLKKMDLNLAVLYEKAIKLQFVDEKEFAAMVNSQSEASNLSKEEAVLKKECQGLFKNLQIYLGKYDAFPAFFDPCERPRPEIVTAFLSDALVDIYWDIKKGFLLYLQGNVEEAILSWKTTFAYHWGVHLTQALNVIHCLVYLHT